MNTREFLKMMNFENVPSYLEPMGDYVSVYWLYNNNGNRVTQKEESVFGVQRIYTWDGTLIRECEPLNLVLKGSDN